MERDVDGRLRKRLAVADGGRDPLVHGAVYGIQLERIPADEQLGEVGADGEGDRLDRFVAPGGKRPHLAPADPAGFGLEADKDVIAADAGPPHLAASDAKLR